MRNNSVRCYLLVLFCLLNSTSVGPESAAITQPTATSSSSTTSTSTSSSSHKPSIIGPIIGSVVGGVFALALISLAVILLLRRRQSEPVVTTWDPRGPLPDGKAAMGYPLYPVPFTPPEHSPLLYVSHLAVAFQ